MSLGALVIALESYSRSVEVPPCSTANEAATRRHLDALIHRLDEIEAKLDSVRLVDSHSAAREQVNTTTGDWESDRRRVYEKLAGIESMLRNGAYATASLAQDLQTAMQIQSKVDPAAVDGVRVRVETQDRLRDAFLFHTRKQMIEILGPPHEIGVRQHGVEEWTYRGGNGKPLRFLIHDGLVFNAWM